MEATRHNHIKIDNILLLDVNHLSIRDQSSPIMVANSIGHDFASSTWMANQLAFTSTTYS